VLAKFNFHQPLHNSVSHNSSGIKYADLVLNTFFLLLSMLNVA